MTCQPRIDAVMYCAAIEGGVTLAVWTAVRTVVQWPSGPLV